MVGSFAGAGAVAGAWAAFIALAMAGLAGAVAGTVDGTVAVVVAEAAGADMLAVLAGEKLQKSFSKFHTFLIWLGTSWLGLGLGWLLGSIFR
ncbi:MAG: hypothetical protein RID09_30530 [Coleofasciculus sp. G1-WW12-02]|uniref:hypothetical protein n=1 Tax=Coleofasciculus sp. G1-WW12-02 TaxID=3068483 RepID=UPI0032FDB712